MEYAYKRVSTRGFGETIDAVERSVRDHGFVVEEVHDIRARLEAKGFPIRQLVIFEVAPEDKGSDDMIRLLMPCRINVYEEADDVIVAALRPTLFKAVYPEHELDALAQKVESDVVSLVDRAVD